MAEQQEAHIAVAVDPPPDEARQERGENRPRRYGQADAHGAEAERLGKDERHEKQVAEIQDQQAESDRHELEEGAVSQQRRVNEGFLPSAQMPGMNGKGSYADRKPHP